MPEMVLTRVDLPAPLSPTRPTTSPAATSKSTPSSACTAPNLLLTPRRARSGVLEFMSWCPFTARGRAARRQPALGACLLEARRLARRRVRGRTDLRHRPELVLHDRVLDVALRDRDRGQDHGGHGLLAVAQVLVDQARRRLLALSERARELRRVLSLLGHGLVDRHVLDPGDDALDARERRVLSGRRPRLRVDARALHGRDPALGHVVVRAVDGGEPVLAERGDRLLRL